MANTSMAPVPNSVWRAFAVTAVALFVWRVAAVVPVPGISAAVFEGLVSGPGATGLLDLVWNTNRAVRFSIIALGLLPYLTAWITLELWAAMSRGRATSARKVASDQQRFEQRVRILAFGLAAFQGYGIAVALEHVTGLVVEPGAMFRVGVIASLVAGLALQCWLAEIISRHGLCNGIWLLVAADFISALPRNAVTLLEADGMAAVPRSITLILALFLVAAVALIVLVTRAVYRFALADGSTLPLRLNLFGLRLLPFAYPVVMLPLSLAALVSEDEFAALQSYFSYGQLGQVLVLALLILVLIWHYTMLAADPRALPWTLRSDGQIIPGVAPGASRGDACCRGGYSIGVAHRVRLHSGSAGADGACILVRGPNRGRRLWHCGRDADRARHHRSHQD